MSMASTTVTKRKSCLKSNEPTPAPSPSPDSDSKSNCNGRRKCVAFCEEGSEQVWYADEWDRTPTEPTRKLSYQDILELKAIQKTLPRALQQPDPYSKRPHQNQYLANVPIGLLPLLPDTPATLPITPTSTPVSETAPQRPPPTSLYTPPNRNNFPSPPTATNSISNPNSVSPKPQVQAPTPTVTYSAPSSLFPHGFAKRSAPPPSPPSSPKPPPPAPRHISPRPKATFHFVPLLDSPNPPTSADASPSTSNPDSEPNNDPIPSAASDTDPPTPSLTNASLDSSPCPSPSPSPTPSFSSLSLTMPEDQKGMPDESYFPPFSDGPSAVVSFKRKEGIIGTKGIRPLPSPGLLPPSPFELQPSHMATFGADNDAPSISPPKPKKRKERKKQVIYVNDMEIELDQYEPDEEDDNEEEEDVDVRGKKEMMKEGDEEDKRSNTPKPVSPTISAPTPTTPANRCRMSFISLGLEPSCPSSPPLVPLS